MRELMHQQTAEEVVDKLQGTQATSTEQLSELSIDKLSKKKRKKKQGLLE